MQSLKEAEPRTSSGSESFSQGSSPPLNRMLVAVTALLGFAVSLYMLAYATGLVGTLVCNVGSCETVQASPYSRILGIPVAAFGAVGYLALMGVALLGLQPRFAGSRRVAALLIGGGVVGVGFSAYLTYLEAFVIHAWCQWCIISAVLMVVAFLFSVPEFKTLGGSS